jgi:FKBP-type peptidyl-prolyl cis-trans isomerase
MSFPRLLSAIVLAAPLTGGCQQQPAEPPAKVMTEDQKAIYAFGVAVGHRVGEQAKQIRLTPDELAVFKTGLDDALAEKTPAVEVAEYQEKFQALAQARLEAGAAEAQQQGVDFAAAAEKEPGAVKTDSGLVYRTLTAGKGPSPKATDTVRVHYHGTLTDGKVFDSSVDRGEPAEFPLNRVIPCWTEGVQLMKVGEKAKFVCPAAIAYGDRGAGADIPPGATLVFEVELLEIK